MEDIGHFFIGESFFLYQFEDQFASRRKPVDGLFHFFPHLGIDTDLFGIATGKGDIDTTRVQGKGGPGFLVPEHVQAFIAGDHEEPDTDIFDLHQSLPLFPQRDHGIGSCLFSQFAGTDEASGKSFERRIEDVEKLPVGGLVAIYRDAMQQCYYVGVSLLHLARQSMMMI